MIFSLGAEAPIRFSAFLFCCTFVSTTQDVSKVHSLHAHVQVFVFGMKEHVQTTSEPFKIPLHLASKPPVHWKFLQRFRHKPVAIFNACASQENRHLVVNVQRVVPTFGHAQTSDVLFQFREQPDFKRLVTTRTRHVLRSRWDDDFLTADVASERVDLCCVLDCGGCCCCCFHGVSSCRCWRRFVVAQSGLLLASFCPFLSHGRRTPFRARAALFAPPLRALVYICAPHARIRWPGFYYKSSRFRFRMLTRS